MEGHLENRTSSPRSAEATVGRTETAMMTKEQEALVLRVEESYKAMYVAIDAQATKAKGLIEDQRHEAQEKLHCFRHAAIGALVESFKAVRS